jgi:cation transport regulator ChaC
MYRYFAYGSVLSKRHLGEWAAEHGVDARLFARGLPAVLRGYSLVFNVESRFWGGRVANLREDKDGVVHGVLFEIPVPAKDAVLRKEGVPTGLSQETDVTVEADGQQVAAKAFVARPEKRTEPGAPSGRLLGYLVEGAEERGLPAEWIATLRKHAESAAPVQPPPAPVGLKPVGLKPGLKIDQKS